MRSTNRHGSLYDAFLLDGKKRISAEEYVDLATCHADEIISAEFILPRIGSDSFGEFEVELRTPTYEVSLG
ncbi:hypothetical protein SAMN05216509_4038 [Pseudomonas sp. B10]|uniref:hypothetical protein n=1 Tax=Pseudomonas sp. B10 TaxID=118613 RepID=UPI0009537674|nr:hypothetical protein [Pseudomonas sp. B10]SIR69699.1 hypothetical protein SAMN05216509_4038 [Pseudomonas sp. B10]